MVAFFDNNQVKYRIGEPQNENEFSFSLGFLMKVHFHPSEFFHKKDRETCFSYFSSLSKEHQNQMLSILDGEEGSYIRFGETYHNCIVNYRGLNFKIGNVYTTMRYPNGYPLGV